jgi:spore coat polysaccharide biosynthesis protein SpsF
MINAEAQRSLCLCVEFSSGFGMSGTLAFLQARMGSARLPGKVLMRIQGQSILERAIRRLRAARVLDGVVVLTTMLPQDDVVEQEARSAGADVFRGPELDVLRRFQLASDRFAPDFVIRATADNPLIDIGSVDRIVFVLKHRKLDWCMETGLPVGAATEIMTAAALRRVDSSATEQRHREHVTLYIKENPLEFRTALLEPPGSVRRPDVSITIDTTEDFKFVNQMICRLPDERFHPIPLESYLDLYPGS